MFYFHSVKLNVLLHLDSGSVTFSPLPLPDLKASLSPFCPRGHHSRYWPRRLFLSSATSGSPHCISSYPLVCQNDPTIRQFHCELYHRLASGAKNTGKLEHLINLSDYNLFMHLDCSTSQRPGARSDYAPVFSQDRVAHSRSDRPGNGCFHGLVSAYGGKIFLGVTSTIPIEYEITATRRRCFREGATG
jgi:hypothetical protein